MFSGSGKMTADMLSAQVNVVSYDLAVRLASVLKECSFQLVIAVSGREVWGQLLWVIVRSIHYCTVLCVQDESHFLKNYKTARCKAILPLVKVATGCMQQWCPRLHPLFRPLLHPLLRPLLHPLLRPLPSSRLPSVLCCCRGPRPSPARQSSTRRWRPWTRLSTYHLLTLG